MKRGLLRTMLGVITMVAIFAGVLVLLFGCGGGGSSPVHRDGWAVTYYGGTQSTVAENYDHISAHWATGWAGGTGAWHLDMTRELVTARGLGVTDIVLALPAGLALQPNSEDEMTFQFTRLAQAGVLDGWRSIMVYVEDEPNLIPAITDIVMTAANARVRSAMSKFPALSGKPLGVIYACDEPGRPGIKSFDVVGCDSYDKGCDVLKESYPALQVAAPDRKLMLVVGAADKLGGGWRQDPKCFEDYANANAKVSMVVVFVWQDFAAPGVGLGVRSNGMRPAICAMGKRALGKNPDNCVKT